MTEPLPLDTPAAEAPIRDASRRLEVFRSRCGLADASLEPLVREAGERVYFRIRQQPEGGRGAARTLVLCVMSRPYEPGTLPFANSAALYRRIGVRAPAILEEAPDLGVLALDDLGDDLLQKVALRGDAATSGFYGEAVGIIARIQREGARVGQAADAARFRAFSERLDSALFLRELRFFARHFLEGHANRRLPRSASDELDSLFRALAEEAAGGPQVLCHRDFHSRNLIAGPPSPPGAETRTHLQVIDHQDSRMGPRGYDLMSLVRDPYVAVPEPLGMPFVETDLAARFHDAAGVPDSPAERAAEFDGVALQRNLKALGTYGFQVCRRRNEVYGRFIPPTLTMVRDNLGRHRDRRDRRRLFALLSDLVGLD